MPRRSRKVKKTTNIRGNTKTTKTLKNTAVNKNNIKINIGGSSGHQPIPAPSAPLFFPGPQNNPQPFDGSSRLLEQIRQELVAQRGVAQHQPVAVPSQPAGSIPPRDGDSSTSLTGKTPNGPPIPAVVKGIDREAIRKERENFIRQREARVAQHDASFIASGGSQEALDELHRPKSNEEIRLQNEEIRKRNERMREINNRSGTGPRGRVAIEPVESGDDEFKYNEVKHSSNAKKAMDRADAFRRSIVPMFGRLSPVVVDENQDNPNQRPPRLWADDFLDAQQGRSSALTVEQLKTECARLGLSADGRKKSDYIKAYKDYYNR